MYQFSYADIVEESSVTGRAREREAILKTIEMMTAGEKNGPQSREAIEALLYVQRLWGILIEDLAKPENALPSKLRADLISIGLWVFREVEAIRLGNVKSFKSLIEISRTIAEGLK
jgi:flagellar biosynthesis activator protein FlaF